MENNNARFVISTVIITDLTAKSRHPLEEGDSSFLTI
jgi:hypothetical protein